MGIARNIARLIPNGSGLLPNANIEAVAASKLTGQVPDANAPSGSVIQVVFAQKKDTQTITNTAGITEISGLSASITPISTSSRILVQSFIMIATTTGSSIAAGILLYRNGSNISDATANAASNRPRMWMRNDSFAGISSMPNFNADHGPNIMTGFYLDSPSSASSITYSVRLRPQTNSGNYVINRAGNDSDVDDMWGARSTSGLILMEISQ